MPDNFFAFCRRQQARRGRLKSPFSSQRKQAARRGERDAIVALQFAPQGGLTLMREKAPVSTRRNGSLF